MKIQVYFLLALCCFSLQAETNENLLKGINLFESGLYDEARRVFVPLAESNNGMANYYLGLILDPTFNRVPYSRKHTKYNGKIEKKMKLFYTKAVSLDVNYALFRLSEYYRTTYHIRGDYRRGDSYARKAERRLVDSLKSNDWLASYMLARLEPSKYGKEAVSKLEVEATSGNFQAQFYLGKIYSGTPCYLLKCRNLSQAFAWFVVAAAQGSYHTKVHLQSIMENMSKDELNKGKKLGNEYLLKYRNLKSH